VLAAIVRLTDLAQSTKPAIAVAAERAARWFVAAVIVLAGISAGVWYLIDPARALWVALSVLIVTCPCALSLATPAVLAAANRSAPSRRRAGHRGTRARDPGKGNALRLRQDRTLTLGRLSLVGIIPLGSAVRERCLALAAALEAHSEHPLAKAIVAAHVQRVMPATQLRNDAGRGVEGRIGDSVFRIGRPDFVAELHGKALPDELAFISDDVTLVALGDDSGWIALLTFSDTLRADARRLVGQLAAQGKTVCILSGDRTRRVKHFARELGVTVSRGDATPQEKVDFVAALQASGAVVAMIGDGVNDAPVLARAQVSLAIGGGTQLAHTSSDMIIMSERLQPVLTACDVARASARIIRQNLAWAVAYNAVALPLR
jgi:Cu2+-exporting ATPase